MILDTPFATRSWSPDTLRPHQSRILIFLFLLLFVNAGVRGVDNFSISTFQQVPESAHCSSLRYDLPGTVYSLII